MTLTTTTRARRIRTSSAPTVSLGRSLFLNDPRRESRSVSKSTWVGSLVVQR
jgi:hypothetical protein